MSYQTFKSQWIGKRVDYDKVYGYQCVDLIKQYLNQEYGLSPGAWGNAIDYYYSPNSAILTKFDRLSTKEARTGDIVIFKGVNGNPYGHIGVCDGNAGILTVTTLEQNGSTGNGSGLYGDAIRTRAISKTRVVGVLRPKAARVGMPAVGSIINITKGVARTTYKPGTTTIAKIITATDTTFNYIVRGYDPVYPNRILINSAGQQVALALYYTNGNKIDGWTQK
jgi:hypothetical protein